MESPIHRLDPRTKLLSVFVLMAAVIAGGPAGMVPGGLLIAAGVIVSRIPVMVLWRQVRFIGLIMLFSVFFQVLFTPGEAVFAAGPVKVTAQGLYAGAVLLLKVLLIILAGIVLTSTTTTLRLSSGIEFLFKPLGRLGIPVHEIVMAMSIAIRFVPVINEEARTIMNAQLSRGVGFYGPGLGKRAKAVVSLIVPLLTGVLRRSDDLATAMEARCYRGGAGRSRMHQMTLSRADGICLLLAGTSLVAAVLLRVTLGL
jgi:energy-coupling factor transport system permease protein